MHMLNVSVYQLIWYGLKSFMPRHANFKIPYFREWFPRKLFFFEFNLTYCDLCSQYIKVRKLFKGGKYSRVDTIRGNTVVWDIDRLSSVTTTKSLAQHQIQSIDERESQIPPHPLILRKRSSYNGNPSMV